jgi:hypothetical protein
MDYFNILNERVDKLIYIYIYIYILYVDIKNYNSNKKAMGYKE